MHPHLIHFGPLLESILGREMGDLPLHSFGILMGAGFIAGIAWGMREARRWGIESEAIFNLSFWVMLGGIAGSRLLYVLIDILQQKGDSTYLADPQSILFIWQGGLVWYGGLFGAFGCFLIYAYREKLPIWRTCDVCGPATFFGLAVGRLGCLAVGDDFGRIIEKPEWFQKFGLVFTHPDALLYPPELKGEILHATQIYMALGAFILFLILWWVIKNKRFDGQVTWLAFALYPLIRSIIEIFRGDHQRGYIIDNVLSTSQAISIPTALAGLGLLIYFWMKSKDREIKIKGRLKQRTA